MPTKARTKRKTRANTQAPRKEIEYATEFVKDAADHAQIRLARSTRQSALTAWRAFIRFCNAPGIQISADPQASSKIDHYDMRMFLHWHVNHSRITKLSSVYIFARQFRQAYKLQTGQIMDPKIISKTRHYIENKLQIEFDLREERSNKPTLNANDLIATLHYHWVLSTQ